jgi:4-oxalocrotonate tautomerase
MPFAQIILMEGRTESQKQAAIEKVTTALADAVGARLETIRVCIIEIPNTNWGIAGKPAKDLTR